MSVQKNEWERKDAARSVDNLLEAAKSGLKQTIIDADGIFEVRFVRRNSTISVGRFLSEGTPFEDDDGHR